MMRMPKPKWYQLVNSKFESGCFEKKKTINGEVLLIETDRETFEIVWAPLCSSFLFFFFDVFDVVLLCCFSHCVFFLLLLRYLVFVSIFSNLVLASWVNGVWMCFVVVEVLRPKCCQMSGFLTDGDVIGG